MIKFKKILHELRGLKSLKVFDWDDTLVKTHSNIYVIHADGSQDTLTPAQYAIYNRQLGDKFDFKDFNRTLKNPNPINRNIKLLQDALSSPLNKVTILTARQMAFPIRYYLKKTYGLDVYVVALGDANPQKKAEWIENHIKKGYDDIFFVDDSIKNIEAVSALKEKYPNVKLEVRLAE